MLYELYSKNAGLFQPKCWVKNVQLKVKVEVGLIWNYIFNPTFGFVHILPNFLFKQPIV